MVVPGYHVVLIKQNKVFGVIYFFNKKIPPVSVPQSTVFLSGSLFFQDIRTAGLGK